MIADAKDRAATAAEVADACRCQMPILDCAIEDKPERRSKSMMILSPGGDQDCLILCLSMQIWCLARSLQFTCIG